MSILIMVLYVIGAIVALVLLIALFISKQYSITAEQLIHQSQTDIFNYIVYLKNQDNYSKWIQMDPNVRKSTSGTDATVGFISSWDSDDKNVGQGAQEIMKITTPSRVDYEIRFIRPFKSVCASHMSVTPVDTTSAQVAWSFSGSMPYPMNILLLTGFMQKTIKSDLSVGLGNLKTILEAK